jgi:hypothetical protein
MACTRYEKRWLFLLFLLVFILLGFVTDLNQIHRYGILRAMPVLDAPSAPSAPANGSGPLLHPKRLYPHLPRFNDTGVVFFYHLAKTGGTTIRENFQRHRKRVRVVRAWDNATVASAYREIEDVVNGDTRRLLLIEWHGGVPGLPQLHSKIQHWRAKAAQQRVPFFTTVLVREPLAFHVSHFMFFHHLQCHLFWCGRPLYESTQANLLKAAVPNHQSLMLFRGQRPKYTRQDSMDTRDLSSLLDLLDADWDWVGTTEKLQNVTLPILSKILLGDAELGARMRPYNSRHAKNGTELTVETV